MIKYIHLILLVACTSLFCADTEKINKFDLEQDITAILADKNIDDRESRPLPYGINSADDIEEMRRSGEYKRLKSSNPTPKNRRILEIPAEARNWEHFLTQQKRYIELHDSSSILTLFEAYHHGHAAKIADPTIQSIFIKEWDEPLIDITEQAHPRIRMMPNPEIPLASPEYNSGFNDASKIRTSVFKKLEDCIDALDELSDYFGYRINSINIAVFEALRSITTQEKLFHKKRAEIKVLSPHLSDHELDKETATWVSPVQDNIPPHATGSAIDIRLKKGDQFLDMGPFGILWGTNPTAPTFSEDISYEQKKNRLLLLMAATKAGLVNYPYEYWHYSNGDRYGAFCLGQPYAIYNAIDDAQLHNDKNDRPRFMDIPACYS